MKKVLALILFLFLPNVIYAAPMTGETIACDNAVYTAVVFDRANKVKNDDEASVLREKSIQCAEAYAAFLFGATSNTKITPKFFQESLSDSIVSKLAISEEKLEQIKTSARRFNKLP